MSQMKHLLFEVETNAEQINHTVNLLRAHPEYKLALRGLLSDVNKQHIARLLSKITPNKHIITLVIYHLLRHSNETNPDNSIKQDFEIASRRQFE